jgi:hypothetical protein
VNGLHKAAFGRRGKSDPDAESHAADAAAELESDFESVARYNKHHRYHRALCRPGCARLVSNSFFVSRKRKEYPLRFIVSRLDRKLNHFAVPKRCADPSSYGSKTAFSEGLNALCEELPAEIKMGFV